MIEEAEKFQKIAKSFGFNVVEQALRHFNSHICEMIYAEAKTTDLSKLIATYDLEENVLVYYPEIYCFYNDLTDDYEIKIKSTTKSEKDPTESKIEEILSSLAITYKTVWKEVRIKRIIAL